MRLDNIEKTLKEIACAIKTGSTFTTGETSIDKFSPIAIRMIAHELVNTPDVYSRKRKAREKEISENKNKDDKETNK